MSNLKAKDEARLADRREDFLRRKEAREEDQRRRREEEDRRGEEEDRRRASMDRKELEKLEADEKRLLREQAIVIAR